MTQPDARTQSERELGNLDHENAAAPADESKAAKEKQEPTVTEPGGFKNDPDDPTNPNEAIERTRRKLRP